MAEMRKSANYAPIIGSRHTTVISRSTAEGLAAAPQNRQSFRQSVTGSGTIPLQSGVIANVAGKGVNTMKESREKEKKDLQGLNERFASYIERVRFLEAQNKALVNELDTVKNSEEYNPAKIKDMFEVELEQARVVINELSKQKAEFDVKMVGMEDRLTFEKKETDLQAKLADDFRQKYEKVLNQLGQTEGELAAARDRCASYEDELAILRGNLKRIQDDNNRLRADLDNETTEHINMSNKCQSLEEELAFVTSVYEQEIRDLQVLANRDNSDEMRDFWKGELSKAIREIQTEYDNRLDQVRVEMESKYNNQIREIKVGQCNSAPPQEAGFAKEEAKRWKNKMIEQNSQISELQARNAFLESRVKSLSRDMEDREQMFEHEKARMTSDMLKLQAELETVLQELQALMDAKLTLELEISAYRKMLEVEEGRIKEPEAKGKCMADEDMTDDRIYPTKRSVENAEHKGRVTIHRSSKGAVAFTETSPDGRYVTLENTSVGSKGKTQTLDGWKIRRVLADSNYVEYVFGEFELPPGESVKIMCAGAEIAKSGKCLVANFFTWGTGSSTTYLYDDDGAEKASIVQKFVI
ncbi:non-neuronal cytoplasmic intermediate filament protein-like [Liolophura sinensis]|uniref:non-neuronal cytoplasmic intermediate filament protein-like n=1 Tax=Liolophura sinensis TaxID=3198878 RepID=UPI003158FDB5